MPGQATVTIKGKQWSVSVASTSTELIQGLSGVASIPANTGMLFDLGSERTAAVNAYEMLFPISVVFIDEELVVVEVIPLLAIGGTVTPILPCRYFLEVNVSEVDGVELGDEAVITGYTPATESSLIGLVVTVMIIAMVMQMMMRAMKGVG